MSDSRAFVFHIEPNGSGSGEDDSIHQTNPAWVLTFVRWENRDTLRNTSSSATAVRDPLVVENDCLHITVNVNKGTLTPSMNATLVMTDVNYETAVAPGDFVFVNMLNWEQDARRVANQARQKTAINGQADGFKGIFKVQGVRRILTVDPNTGTKIVLFKINGFAFTEFNNTIYFNPYLIDQNQDQKNQLLFASFFGDDWKFLVNKKGLTNVQDIIAVLTQSFLGYGVSDQGRLEKNGTVKSPNVHFYMPQLVGDLLGVIGAKAAKDVYNYLFGIQQYASGANQSLSSGMNPTGLYQKFYRFYYTNIPCAGDSLLKAEYWNQVKSWSILNQYTNAPLNELYTCFRIGPDNKIFPTVVFRQIPFTNEDFVNNFSGTTLPVTRFFTLPRWKINPALILEQDIGREEAARVNFVQYFGKSTVGIEGVDISQEIARGNFLYDISDVQRSGLRPYIVTTQFDEPTDKYKDFKSPYWAKILGDSIIGGHLKLNGSISCAGIIDPIAVGDNLEFDGIVYHIEQVNHTASIANDGQKMFRTSLSLSNGLSVQSNAKGTTYAEMTFPVAGNLRQVDYDNNAILPGVSESQDTVYRTRNPDFNDTQSASRNNPFPEPGANTPESSKPGSKT